MKIYLKVKYEQKDNVKRLGALWDYVGKAWYVESRNVDMSKFQNYMHVPEHLLKPHEPTKYEIESNNIIGKLSKNQRRKQNKKQNAINNKESIRLRNERNG